jgi:hypothetical protein
MKVGMSDLKIASNETRLELADHRGQLNDIMEEIGYRKKHKKSRILHAGRHPRCCGLDNRFSAW